MSPRRGPGRAVLVGAGHAHLQVIAAAASFRRRGHALAIVAPGDFWYSGLATGMLGGLYPPRLDRIDIAALAARGGARFVKGRMAGLERETRSLVLESGERLSYDALSLDLGSGPPAIPGADAPGCYSVKPIERLADLRAELEARFRRGDAPDVVIAGAGPTGAELAGNIARLAAAFGAGAAITLVAGGGILKGLPPGAAAAARGSLEARGVRFRSGTRVVQIEPNRAILADGAELPFDLFVNAGGLQPPPLLRDLGLPVTEAGALVVDAALRSPADPAIHGGGDCIAFLDRELPRIGVYAVREAPVLLANLLAALEGGKPRRFRPQRRFLWIMNLGDGTGLAMRGRFWWHGRSAFRLKDWIDRRFLRRYGSP